MSPDVQITWMCDIHYMLEENMSTVNMLNFAVPFIHIFFHVDTFMDINFRAYKKLFLQNTVLKINYAGTADRNSVHPENHEILVHSEK